MTGAPQHHSINYVEIAVTDMAAAKTFYERAFGWVFNDYGPSYAGIQAPSNGERSEGGEGGEGCEGDEGGESGEAGEVGGLLLVDEPRPAGGPFVILYSEDLDQTATAIRAAGGIVVQGPYEFPGGRRLHFTDPSGNELGVWGSS